MRRVAALLAAVLCGLGIAACGDGAEPGAPEGATLVLDFTPNAVHAGLYAAQARGYFEDEGLDLDIREPSSSADSAKLLEAGRADFAIMDINDFGIARQEGFDIDAIAAVAQRPLASVIAADAAEVRTPADLEGKTVGVTGVPSDDAVLDTVLASAGLPPDAVERRTIGFQSVPLLAAGEIDAATAFWNAEGVELRRQGIPTREFRVDEFGAPRYPELVVAAARPPSGAAGARTQQTRCAFAIALRRGYLEMNRDPAAALQNLLDAVPDLDAAAQEAQFEALIEARAFSPRDRPARDGDAMRSDLVAFPVNPARQWIPWAASSGAIEPRKNVRPGLMIDFSHRWCELEDSSHSGG